MTRLKSFLFGLLLPFQSAKLIVRAPTLLFWSMIPILVTAGLSIWITGTLQTGLHDWIFHLFRSRGWNPQGTGAGILFFLLRILSILAGAFLFSFSASTIAAPFNDFLAEHAEPRATPPLPAPPPTPWLARLKLIRIDLAKSVAAAIGAALALVFSWIPVVNLIVFGVTFLLITFQFVSYPQTRRGQDLFEGLRFLRKHFFASLGFGAVTALLFAVPLISILALPVSVVGGTLLFARAQGRERLY